MMMESGMRLGLGAQGPVGVFRGARMRDSSPHRPGETPPSLSSPSPLLISLSRSPSPPSSRNIKSYYPSPASSDRPQTNRKQSKERESLHRAEMMTVGGGVGSSTPAARALMAGRALLWPMVLRHQAAAAQAGAARDGQLAASAGRALATTTTAPSAAAAADAQPNASSTTSSLDAREARKFGALADKWWDVEAGPFAPLHAMNPARVAFIRDAVLEGRRERSGLAAAATATASTKSHPPIPQQSTTAEPLSGLRILDVGCGGGILAEPLARLGAQVVGVDAAEEGVRAARAHAALDPRVRARTTYRAATAEQLLAELEGGAGEDVNKGQRAGNDAAAAADNDNNHPPCRTPFDVVVASEVIEHVRDPASFLRTLSRLAYPDTGQVVVSTLNRTAAALAVAVVGAEHVARVVPAGTHDWHRFLTPQELAMLATDCGMEMVLAAGMVPDLRAGVAALRGVGRGRGSATNALLSTWRLSASDLRINYIALMQQQRK